MVELATTIWSDGPSSQPYEPEKFLIRGWGTWVEQIITAFTTNGGLVYSSLALLNADLSKAANSMAWVLGDPTVANNGVYGKVGAAGSGSWTRRANLPFSFIVATDTGQGTPNAIIANTSIPVSSSALVWLTLARTNTTSPVTVSFNGTPPLTVKTNGGNDPVTGGLVAGSIVLGIVSGSTFRLVSDQASAAVLSQAEAAAATAVAAATSVVGKEFLAREQAAGASISVLTRRLRIQLFSSSYPGTALAGGAAYRRASKTEIDSAAIPSQAYFRSQDRFMPDGSTDGTNGGYWVLDEDLPTPQMLGARAGVDCTAIVNALLLFAKGRTVYFPEDEYLTAGPWRIRSETTILLDPEAHITLTGPSLWINGEYLNANYATGYNGDGNIAILGGHYDVDTYGGSQRAFFQFTHGRNIRVERARCTSLWRGHYADIAGCSDVSFLNNLFTGHQWQAGDTTCDAINIDAATASGFPALGAWDGTPTRGVRIRDNIFDGCMLGPGTHGATEPSPHHNDIQVVGNTFRNMGRFASWLRYWDDSLWSNNRVEKTLEAAVVLNKCVNTQIVGNKIHGATQGGANNAIQADGCVNCVYENVLSNDGYPINYTNAYRAFNGLGNVYRTDGAKAGSSSLMSIAEDDALRNGQFSKNVGDDTSWGITPPRGATQGFVEVMARTSDAAAAKGIFWYRLDPGAIVVVAKTAGSTSAQTNTALSGTTGTDGLMTVGAGDGKVWIENRTGSGRDVDVVFRGG